MECERREEGGRKSGSEDAEPDCSCRASEDVAEYGAISLKPCLHPQLSWQLTLLHMDKRGLWATRHVSAPQEERERESELQANI